MTRNRGFENSPAKGALGPLGCTCRRSGWVVIGLALMCIVSCGQSRRAVAQRESFRLLGIELQRRNWESRGTDISIDSTGAYVVAFVAVDQRDTLRRGTLSNDEWAGLERAAVDARLFALPVEYRSPFKTRTDWWGYSLAVRTTIGRRTIRFHSEDDSVPAPLRQFTGEVIRLTGLRKP